MEVKVSIVVTCYNLGQYLQDLFGSISWAFNESFEVILIDDGSNEQATILEIKALEQNYGSVRIVKQENMGLARARNKGVALANGKYIIPVDADNRLVKKGVYDALKFLEANEDYSVAYGNAKFFGNRTGLWQNQDYNHKAMVLKNHIDACAIIRKCSLKEVGMYDVNMPVMGFEDWDLWLRMYLEGLKFKYIPEIFFEYRVREGSMLKENWEKRDVIVDYIFNREKSVALKHLRELAIENEYLKRTKSTKELLYLLANKITKRLYK